MKNKKLKFSGNRPVLFWQPDMNRMRIFYPNGSSDWSASYTNTWASLGSSNPSKFRGCCYALKATSIDDCVNGMNEYDESRMFNQAIFLGEL